METTATLNENEATVLAALNAEAQSSTGGEFGYLPDVKRGKFSKHEFAGYVSALKAKGVFEYLDTDSGEEYEGQYAINEEYK